MKRKSLGLLFVTSVMSTLLSPGPSWPAAGDLDPGFGDGGLVKTKFQGSVSNSPSAVITQADDRILVAGFREVIRYTAGGQLDATFGNAGVAPMTITPTALAIQPPDVSGDDRIIVVGTVNSSVTGNDFAIARLLLNGTLDPSFGTNGITTIDFLGDRDQAVTVTIQGDKKILIGGLATEPLHRSSFALARLDKNGHSDSSFGAGTGRVMSKIYSDTADTVFGVVQLSTGRIVAGGTTRLFSFADFALVGYLSNGNVDTDFGTNGLTTTDFFSNEDDASAMALAPGDKVVLVGWAIGPVSTDFAIARYTSTGDPDTTFSGDGRLNLDVGGESDDDLAFGVKVLADNSVLVSGALTSSSPASGDIAAIKVKNNGTLDDNFGAGGIARFDYDGRNQDAARITVQSTGKIILAGSTDGSLTATANDFLLVRFSSGGLVDTTFGNAGVVQSDIPGPVSSRARDVLVRSNGSILTGGVASLDFGFTQYTGTGEPDPDFGVDGKVVVDFDMLADGIQAIAEGAGGSVVAVGTTRPPGGGGADFGMVRLTANGSLDSGFGTGGYVSLNFFGGTDEAFGVAIQDDQKVVVTGTATTLNGPTVFLVARYKEDGTPDSDFGVAGVATVDFPGDFEFAADVLIQPDNKIVVVGLQLTPGPSGFDIALARLTSGGAPDPAFGTGGKIAVNAGGTDVASAVAVGPGNTLVIGGYTNATGGGDFLLLRRLDNGDPDPDFGIGGMVRTDLSGANSADRILDLAMQPDGKIVAVGCSGAVSCSGFAVARYLANGNLDTSTPFGVDGIKTDDFGSLYAQANGVAIQDNGAIVVAGEVLSDGFADFAVARYQGDQPAVTCGDANSSNTITAGDALLALRSAVGSAQCLLCICDANKSGTVSASDALLILRKAVGQNVTLNCPAAC